jgi:hypothetical protein
VLPSHAPILLVAACMIPVGVGGSFTVPPVTSLLIDSVSAHQAGAASGVLNTFRQMGGSLGVAASAQSLRRRPFFAACESVFSPPPFFSSSALRERLRCAARTLLIR